MPSTLLATHLGPALAAFLAALVEAVEALTVILAVGATRGWRSAIAGAAAGLLTLLILVALLGPAVLRVPQAALQLTVGTLILLFGMRWLRKAILRTAGLIPLHDEDAAYAKTTTRLSPDRPRPDRPRPDHPSPGYPSPNHQTSPWDRLALATAFQITMLEGIEVVFIIVAIGAGGSAPLTAAAIGAAAALILVILLGAALHRPLSSIPENTLKFTVGVLLCAFGTFWAGEGMGLDWPAADWSVLALATGFAATSLLAVPLCRRTRQPA